MGGVSSLSPPEERVESPERDSDDDMRRSGSRPPWFERPGISPNREQVVGAGNDLDSVAVLAVLIAAGVLLIAVGYQLGREQSAGGTALYWLGQSLLFLPLFLRLLSSRPLGTTAVAVVLSLFGCAQVLGEVLLQPARLSVPR